MNDLGSYLCDVRFESNGFAMTKVDVQYSNIKVPAVHGNHGTCVEKKFFFLILPYKL